MLKWVFQNSFISLQRGHANHKCQWIAIILVICYDCSTLLSHFFFNIITSFLFRNRKKCNSPEIFFFKLEISKVKTENKKTDFQQVETVLFADYNQTSLTWSGCLCITVTVYVLIQHRVWAKVVFGKKYG